MIENGEEHIKASLHKLIRNMILSTPDRSEYRVKVAQVIRATGSTTHSMSLIAPPTQLLSSAQSHPINQTKALAIFI